MKLFPSYYCIVCFLILNIDSIQNYTFRNIRHPRKGHIIRMSWGVRLLSSSRRLLKILCMCIWWSIARILHKRAYVQVRWNNCVSLHFDPVTETWLWCWCVCTSRLVFSILGWRMLNMHGAIVLNDQFVYFPLVRCGRNKRMIMTCKQIAAEFFCKEYFAAVAT